MGYIYKITSPTNKNYIGQAKDFKCLMVRKSTYKKAKCKTQPKLFNSIKKYGWENHIFEIIDECKFNGINNFLLNILEKYWIEELGTLNNGLNCTSGGDNNFIRSEESKRKTSESLKGNILSDETKRKISESLKGKIPTEEARRKMSEAHMGENNHFYGKKHTKETIDKLSNFNKGKIISEEAKKKIGEFHKGKPRSEETKKKISENSGIKIRCVETGETFNSIKEATNKMNLNNISYVLSGKRKSTGGYTFIKI